MKIFPSRWCIFSVSPLFLVLILSVSALAARPALRVAITPEQVHFEWSAPLEGQLSLRALPIQSTAGTPQAQDAANPVLGRIVWTGSASAGSVALPRFENGEDRLFLKYQLVSNAGTSLESAQYVTDFHALPRRTGSLGLNASKKGIACLLDPADGLALGMQQLNQNISINALLDLESTAPKMSFEYEGRRIGLREGAVKSLDSTLIAAHRASQRVTGILLNNVSRTTPRSSPLVHPLSDPSVVPIGPSAFNTATAEGVFYYRAILHWLVERYTREDAAFGHLAGLVIGNEMQSHWSWYHLGLVEPELVIGEYTIALRIADLVTRSIHADFPLYVSLEHHWTMSASEDSLKGFSAVEALDGISAIAQAGGDFPWNLAFHPYPENLFEPRFWNDRTAPLRFDAPRLTFHNLEVLPAFLRQPNFLFEGRTRRIALTEQGFHCSDKAEGEFAQAAAYAFAWKKIQALPDIESFLYHRHVDHPLEDGLRCGFRAHDGTPNVNGIGRARKIWEVAQAAGTSKEDEAFAFALPMIGRANWEHVVATEFEPSRPSKRLKGRLVYDFVRNLKAGVPENIEPVQTRRIGPPEEVQESAFQEHPKPRGRGRLTFKVALPACEPESSEGLFLEFDALLNHLKSDGASFHVEIDGREIYSRVLHGGERESARLELSEWQGREVAVAFGVDALADPAFDWTTWVSPRVVLGAR